MLQNEHFISHRTLKMLLHYLVKPYCFKNRIITSSSERVKEFLNDGYFAKVST